MQFYWVFEARRVVLRSFTIFFCRLSQLIPWLFCHEFECKCFVILIFLLNHTCATHCSTISFWQQLIRRLKAKATGEWVAQCRFLSLHTLMLSCVFSVAPFACLILFLLKWPITGNTCQILNLDFPQKNKSNMNLIEKMPSREEDNSRNTKEKKHKKEKKQKKQKYDKNEKKKRKRWQEKSKK